MEELESRRRYARVNVGPDHWVRFHHSNINYRRLPMTNLSAGGCCVRMLPSEGKPLEKGAVLSMVRLMHPAIPNVPLLGRVMWIMGKQSDNQDGVVLLGIEFVNPNPEFMAILDEYVKGLLAENR